MISNACTLNAKSGRRSVVDVVVSVVRRITLEADLAATRFSLALAETFWAVSLIFSDDIMSAEKYSVMAQTMGQKEWGLIFAVIGLMQWAILISGRYHGRAAAALAGMSAFVWWYVIIGLMASQGDLPIAIGSELSLGFAAAWVLIRTGIDRCDTQCLALKKKERLRG